MGVYGARARTNSQVNTYYFYPNPVTHPYAHVRAHTGACSHTHAEIRTSSRGTHRYLRFRILGRVLFHRRITPLHYAAIYGHTAVAAALLAHGADVNAENNGGCGGRSLLCLTVGMHRAAMADRDGIDAMQM